MIESLAALRAQFSTQPPRLSQFDEDHPCRLKQLSLDQQKKRAPPDLFLLFPPAGSALRT